MILPISASQVARITGVHHWNPAPLNFLLSTVLYMEGKSLPDQAKNEKE
jgi:hypothetical protein